MDGFSGKARNLDYGVYLVTDRSLCLGRSLLDVIAQAVQGGASVVQLREKDCATRDFVDLARRVKDILAPTGIPLIINDRADVALACGADGLHVGQTDMAYGDARMIMGPDAIMGLSVETVEQAADAQSLDVDYLGVGPIFPTLTKSDAAPAMGLEGLAKVRALSRHVLVAIGSITPENARDVIRAGADGLAVVSAICSHPNPREAAALLRRSIK